MLVVGVGAKRLAGLTKLLKLLRLVHLNLWAFVLLLRFGIHRNSSASFYCTVLKNLFKQFTGGSIRLLLSGTAMSGSEARITLTVYEVKG